MKNSRVTKGAIVLAFVLAVIFLLEFHRSAARRACSIALRGFQADLSSDNAQRLLDDVVLPKALRARAAHERAQFLRSALRNEISPAGLEWLFREGSFGPLKQIFPADATKWARDLSLDVNRCMAFTVAGAKPRVEVILEQDGDRYRVARCNNAVLPAIQMVHK